MVPVADLPPLDSSLYISTRSQKYDVSEREVGKRMREDVRLLTQMPNFSVLLGSGASHYLGSPNIRSFSRESLNRLSEATGEVVSAEAHSVLSNLASTPTDLEHLLQKLTAAIDYMETFHIEELRLGHNSFPVRSIHQARAALNRFLVAICDLPARERQDEPLDPHLHFFVRLLAARAPDLPRIRVFTTNYDLVIEKALDQAGIHYFDGFRGNLIRRLDLNAYTSDLYRKPNATSRGLMPVHEVVHLYKIHGSLNWRSKATAAGLTARDIFQSTEPITDNSLAVVYPTPTKETDTLGYPYSDLLRIFGVTMSQPESVLVVAGYGFRDDHINRLVAQALAHNPTLQLLIAEPFGVIKKMENHVPDYAGSILGRLMTRADHRVRLFTGGEAKFENLYEVLPEAADVTGIDARLTHESNHA